MRDVWRADTPERRKTILTQLMGGEKRFTDLHRAIKQESRVGWAKQTLNLYLKALVEEGCIKRVKSGKSVTYSLNRDHPYVGQVLGNVLVRGSIKLSELEEKSLIEEWIGSIKFNLLNILQDYMLLGTGKEELRSLSSGATTPISHFIEGHLSDISEICRFYGRVLAKGIENGKLDPEKVWDERNRILKEIKARWKRPKLEPA